MWHKPLKQVYYSFLVLASSVSFLSCDREKEQVPAYIHITKFSFTTDFGTQGHNSQDITDAHVYANNEYVGTYELPATIPLKQTGNIQFQIMPGIRENGSSSSRFVYKPYTVYTDTFAVTPGKVDTIKPKTTYRSTAFFAWIEDFEDQAVSMVRSGKSNTNDTLQIIDGSDPNLFEPGPNSRYSGFIDLGLRDSTVIFERTTLNSYLLPKGGQDVYLELDYKANTYIQVGLYAEKPTTYEQIPMIVLYPTDKWRKIYINLKGEVSYLDDNVKCKIFFGLYNNDANLRPKVYLDNFKLVYLN